MTATRYATPAAFKQALEDRIRRHARAEGIDMGRFRQLQLFDRWLARVFAELGDRVVVKGGVVLELRLARARTTRDVDLGIWGDPDTALERLQAAGRRDLGDFLSFIVVPDREHPTLEGEGMPYGGRRFRVETRLAGQLYGMPFGVDVGIADAMTTAADVMAGSSFFAFAGVAPAALRLYPRVIHVAEKLHAYTMPRRRENSRVKDLPDLALLATTGTFAAVELRRALAHTFGFRGTHALPSNLPDPPASWAPAYERMAAEDSLRWATLPDVLAAARAFLDPVLGDEAGTWDPGAWGWRRAAGDYAEQRLILDELTAEGEKLGEYGK
ncbi:MAG TPA: nucleotidyl transferase AbiEii/AbiGii toxin family protein [Polyangia bacterium]|jgi:hypothetical protein